MSDSCSPGRRRPFKVVNIILSGTNEGAAAETSRTLWESLGHVHLPYFIQSSSNICVRLCKLNQIASLQARCKSCLLAFAQPSAGKVHGSGSGRVSWLQTKFSLSVVFVTVYL